MTDLTPDRRLVFYDSGGTPYRPVKDGGSGRSVFKVKPKGAGNRADEAIIMEDWLEVARAMLVDGLAARCKPFAGGQVNYIRFGAEKFVRYELDPEIAQALGIPAQGTSGDVTPVVSRKTVEQAMDAYDQYRLNGTGGEIFSRFGEPRDLWVRSTKERTDRKYPTKPIFASAAKVRDPMGGWSTIKSAAAKLHNAGFIIVDQDDKPVLPPEPHDHLIDGADRVRLCALNYFIEPAREKNSPEATISSGDLAAAIGMKDAFANICQALGGEKFQLLAKVPPPTDTKPNPSSTTIFTYRLASQAKADIVTDVSKAATPSTTNLILYGPPGTGKTFATAFEAVRLCLGDTAAVPLSEKRDALMEVYRDLVGEGRIEFVTFHQSFSYEDFVEGLRPTTDKAKDEDAVSDAPASAGFSLKPHAGMFKQISERARLDTGTAVETRLDRNRNLFKLSLIGNAWRPLLERSLAEGRMFWGFGGKVDWTFADYDQFEAIKARWLVDHPDANGRYADVSGTWHFRAAVEIDDYVVLTVGKNQIVALGRVTGPYEFHPENEDTPHSRTVDWIWFDAAGTDRSVFYPEKFSAFQPIYRLDDETIDWDALETIAYKRDALQPTAGARDFVLIIDEINRANISKVFGELITLLEVDKRLGCQNEVRLRLPYSGTSFGVPANLHIIGTMNTADRSIALLDTALRRRFTFRELMPDPTRLGENVDGINLRKLLVALNDRIEYLFDREHQIGHAYFTGCVDRVSIEEVMRHRVIPLLSEYFYDDLSKVAAVLGDRPFAAKTHFLEAKRLSAPAGLLDDEMGEEKVRWSVKAVFDFAEFLAS